MSGLADLLTIVAVSAGAFFFLAGSLGFLRFPDPLSRLHAVTKADTLGLGLIIVGLLPTVDHPLTAVKMLLVWVAALVAAATIGPLAGQLAREDLDTPMFDGDRTP
ncbi:MAG: monovalent cation/H(+) antiporter subunit G [Phycisphaeraceae bacterium]|nr:monovalent cation/H(+) antiporter subunit G [Phycisphaeraceae bacterium]